MNRLGMTLKEVYQFIQKDLRKYCEQHCYANVNYIAVQEYYGEEKIVEFNNQKTITSTEIEWTNFHWQ